MLYCLIRSFLPCLAVTAISGYLTWDRCRLAYVVQVCCTANLLAESSWAQIAIGPTCCAVPGIKKTSTCMSTIWWSTHADNITSLLGGYRAAGLLVSMQQRWWESTWPLHSWRSSAWRTLKKRARYVLNATIWLTCI